MQTSPRSSKLNVSGRGQTHVPLAKSAPVGDGIRQTGSRSAPPPRLSGNVVSSRGMSPGPLLPYACGRIPWTTLPTQSWYNVPGWKWAPFLFSGLAACAIIVPQPTPMEPVPPAVSSSQGDACWFGGCVQLHPSPLYSFIEEWSTSVLTSNPSPGGSHASLVG